MKLPPREIRNAFSQREAVHMPVSGNPSPTKQEFLKEVNINSIIAKMRKGISPPPWMTAATPRYGDFTNLPVSFQEAFAIMETGQAAFASLPLEMRRAADHDPRKMDQIPREMYKQFGLLKEDASAESPTGDPQATVPVEGKGEHLLPSKSLQGSKKAVQKPAQEAE